MTPHYAIAPAPGEIPHITVDTGDVRSSPRSEVDDTVVEALGVLLAQARVDNAPIPGLDGWTLKVTDIGGAVIATALAPIEGLSAPAATFGVARDADDGAALWRSLHKPAAGRAAPATDPDHPPAPPWLAVRLEIGAGLLAAEGRDEVLAALADFERCLAWAWLERQ